MISRIKRVSWYSTLLLQFFTINSTCVGGPWRCFWPCKFKKAIFTDRKIIDHNRSYVDMILKSLDRLPVHYVLKWKNSAINNVITSNAKMNSFLKKKNCSFSSKAIANVFLKVFLHSRSSSETLHLKIFLKTLILAFEVNSALACQNGLFSAF